MSSNIIQFIGEIVGDSITLVLLISGNTHFKVILW